MQNARAVFVASRITWKATLNRPIYKYARENMEKRRERKKGRETKDKERDWGRRSRKGAHERSHTDIYSRFHHVYVIIASFHDTNVDEFQTAMR